MKFVHLKVVFLFVLSIESRTENTKRRLTTQHIQSCAADSDVLISNIYATSDILKLRFIFIIILFRVLFKQLRWEQNKKKKKDRKLNSENKMMFWKRAKEKNIKKKKISSNIHIIYLPGCDRSLYEINYMTIRNGWEPRKWFAQERKAKI